jgi:cyclic beta-1,2-glucan synthetase
VVGPIHGELLGHQQLAERARAVATAQHLAPSRRGLPRARLLARLDDSRRILDDANERLTAVDDDVDVGPAGEWLLDNFHVVREHIREVRESLPRGYYHELPELASGPLAGYPRVYEVAITLISHTEGRIDIDNVDLFVEAFQQGAPLSIGELWAIPAMLRLGLIESVRRMALRTVQRLDEIERADIWATRIQAANEAGGPELGTALAELVNTHHKLTPEFVSRFLYQLRLGAGAFPGLVWLEQWIHEEGIAPDDAAARSTQRMAMTQIMMANSIMSLRAIGRMDWRTFVERQSAMEAVLREDPSGYYARMSFDTRDSYRHAVERIAKRAGLGEETVARQAIDLARGSAESPGHKTADEAGIDARRAHVGYYLVDRGITELERATGYRPTVREAIHRWVLHHPNVVFVGGIVSGTVVALAAVFWMAGVEAHTAWVAVLLLVLIPANDIAVTVMSQLVTAFMPPRTLPKLDFTDGGVPEEFRTAVVIPTLFASVEAVHDALENLEVQFLANREAHLHFAVLSDFTDSPTETRDDDAAITAAAVEGVRALNARYASGIEDAFHLLHRPRRWNAREGVWMGWERKRGKLDEFNRFLRGEADGAFSVVEGEVDKLRQSRYVITLDSDTVLPPDSAPSLVGAIAHPLNRAWYDERRGRVTRGYGILQPRVGVWLPSAHRSRFAEIHSGHPGVDPYTTAVSDVYQDLYGEGSFTGKGIYDVAIFQRATRGRFPENTLLSHDLIEGSYARAGLATDITVFDDYPARYLTYTRRKHRWIRGDWQLLQWLTPRVPGPDGREPNRLSLLSRWKIFDNLRRSTLEIAMLTYLVAGWTLLPGSPLRWTVLGLAAMATPWIVSLLLAVLRPPLDKSWRAYYAAVGEDALTSVQQIALSVTFLPHQAWVSADAIVRTLYRLFISRRSLLEWQPSSHSERSVPTSASYVWRRMWPGVAIAAIVAALVVLLHASGQGAASGALLASGVAAGDASSQEWMLAIAVVPLIALWLASPAIADALSSPAVRHARKLPAESRSAAMRFALLHWRYFDRFATAETHWLAPDNFQDDPVPVVAMRASPTNIGLQLLATVSAYDLGFITVEDMTHRLELVFQSLERMSRLKGHFFNWYDLRDLSVLEPAYISTVDSGNLAGHLIALRQACLAIRKEPRFDARTWRALETALGMAHEKLGADAFSGDADVRAAASTIAADIGRLRAASIASATSAASRDELLATLAASLDGARNALARGTSDSASSEQASAWVDWSVRLITEERRRLQADSTEALAPRLEALADRAYRYALEMEFGFLYDQSRKLFAVGYQVAAHALDESYYDLLASEARLASYLAIAKNDIPVEHWFHLGRALTRAAGETALVSWSGSMFEYMMPALVMQSFPFTLLGETYRSVVRRHIAYGEERRVPWGISESAYNLRDRHLTYQYRAFGVPDLALKRGLGRDLVIAPYASSLAAMIDPVRALGNLWKLEMRGALGEYGFRDALDYTRPQPGRKYAVVQNYMAHHAGMSFVALTNTLSDRIWRLRFHADPLVRSAEFLLHERVPRRLVLEKPQETTPEESLPRPEMERPAVREVETPNTPRPAVALLGHLPYTIMVSNSGSGYSRYEDLAVTRWRADGTCDATGQFLYVKDVTRDRSWSAAYQPTCAPADWYRTVLATDRVTFQRVDGDIETRTDIAVVPEDSAEVRRVTVTNNAREPREIEITSYGEIVLATPESDRAHPAFANLFVETAWHGWCTAITATRRPRSADERTLWCVHVADASKASVQPVSCETDRARFLGRGRSTRNPVALEHDGALSGTTGAVLDPIFALRSRVRLAPGQSASVAFTTLVATTRERAFELADRYHDPHTAQRALDLAWTATQIELRELDITPADAAVFQEIAGRLFYGGSAMRAPQEELVRNRGAQERLWAMGVSGDWPILLATIDSVEGLPTLRQLFSAHRYWRRRGMMVDLVIVNAHAASYLQELHGRIMEVMYGSSDSGAIDQPGGVFIRRLDLLDPADLLMLRATARVHVTCDGRSLGRIVKASTTLLDSLSDEGATSAQEPRAPVRSAPQSSSVVRRIQASAASLIARPAHTPEPAWRSARPRPTSRPLVPAGTPLSFDNGLGGMASNGDYQVRVHGDSIPPAPWANVVANPHGGFLVTERGAGFTWAGNSYFFRLTPWHNDPVSDPVSDAVYLRDEETGELWSATPAPVGHDSPFTVRHGAGASSFEHEYSGIATRLDLGIPPDSAAKLSVLRLTNRGDRPRRISVTAYVEWTLGVLREHTQHQVRTSLDEARATIFAYNNFDQQFTNWVAFLAMSEQPASHTADRREFLGRNGTVSAPAAMRERRLGGTTGAGIDPCAALQCALELGPGETREIAIVLGAAPDQDVANRQVDAYRDVARARAAMARTVDEWAERLSVVSVRTPEPSFDAMLNRWTLYQTLSCRMWARSALYQSSGAYGFRDQLQDVMALLYAEPALAREHILRSASRQFLEGDVQHWWHPQSGRGVRTRFSDDLVWLPYVVDRYVSVTGDESVLSEYVPFLEMRALEPHEHEVYDLPRVTDEHGSVYEHCLRALRKACTVGAHGLPLIGGGDWNDGMNRVGVEGRGESVWLAWFLVATLRPFAEHAEARGDTEVAVELRSRADSYAAAVESAGWDGEWYRRAYFDDGTPLGSATSEECRIDSIAQSWSTISGAGRARRQSQAMHSLEKHLVHEDGRLIMLLSPPFDKTTRDPGYIKGYLPGVRENGAQYTHAALWAVLATALRGDGNRAFQLFQMLNPLTHASTPDGVATYKVEPYVVAADVYTAVGQLGRGGWTWYTGSASWMYRVALEAILGFARTGNDLTIDPRVPTDWPEYTIEYRHGRSMYTITVHEPGRVSASAAIVTLDGRELDGSAIPLRDDGGRHEVNVRPGAKDEAAELSGVERGVQ